MKIYQMYNGFDDNLLSDFPIIEAKNGADACKKLLDKLGIKYTKVVRDASNNVKIKAEPFKYGENGEKYRDGAVSWFTIYDGDSIY